MGRSLRIYAMRHCSTGEATRQIASEISERCPRFVVDLVYLDDPGTTIPEQVFSVPTYLLGGRVISIGNPYLEQLESLICDEIVQ